MLGHLVLWTASAVHLELHFESLCKQCQIHLAAINDDVFNGGTEDDPAVVGIMSQINTTIDYYDPSGTEHGNDMLVTDRLHLCAQQLAPGNASVWFRFVHCLQMNIDPLKCYSNGHCESVDDFNAALDMVAPMCAQAGRVDLTEIMACANGDQGKQLQAASYKRTAATAAYGFAPAFVDGVYVDGADAFWRKSPDQLKYGTTLLSTVCAALDAAGQTAPTCANISST